MRSLTLLNLKMFFDIFLVLIAAAVGAVVGWRACDAWHATMIREILQRAGINDSKLASLVEDLRQDLPEDHEDAVSTVEIKIEQHGNQFYAYRKDNDEFLAQNLDQAQLIEEIKQKLGKKFTILGTSLSNRVE